MDNEIVMSGFIDLSKKLGQGLDAPVDAATEELSEIMENKATENINKRVYDAYAESPSYKRTGNALGGHISVRLGLAQRKVVFDSLLKPRAMKGQRASNINHTPFLNRNSRIARFNTHFWDDAVTDTQKESSKILQKHVQPYL